METKKTGNDGKIAKSMMRFKLTKKKFMALPNDLFLSSNLLDDDGRPVFANEILDKITRQLQWETIINCGADQRLCEVWQSREVYDVAYLNQHLPMIAKKRRG